MAGLEVPEHMDGLSFADVLIANSNSNREAFNERQILFQYWGEENPHTISEKCPEWHNDKHLAVSII